MGVTIQSVLVRDKALPAADIDGRAVILSLDAGAYFDFNQAATEIWRMLSEPCPVAKILELLSNQHDVDAESLIRDVTPFLQTLIDYRLVRVIDSGETL